MANANISVGIKLLDNGERMDLPPYATAESAGMDLMAAVPERISLPMLRWIAVPCGFSIELPTGYEGQVRPRSGLAIKHGVTILNAPGTIDADYRGEVKAMLINMSETTFIIEPGMRIAQLVIAPVSRVTWHQLAELSSTDRGEGGFGSTGTKRLDMRAA